MGNHTFSLGLQREREKSCDFALLDPSMADRPRGGDWALCADWRREIPRP